MITTIQWLTIKKNKMIRKNCCVTSDISLLFLLISFILISTNFGCTTFVLSDSQTKCLMKQLTGVGSRGIREQLLKKRNSALSTNSNSRAVNDPLYIMNYSSESSAADESLATADPSYMARQRFQNIKRKSRLSRD